MAKSYQRSIRRKGAARKSAAVTKVAISLPAALLASIDRAGKQSGRTRSAVFQEALRAWLGEHETATFVREYVAGYRVLPEDASEIEAVDAAAALLLSEEKW